jgi:hypothetical protein
MTIRRSRVFTLLSDVFIGDFAILGSLHYERGLLLQGVLCLRMPSGAPPQLAAK